MKKFNEQDVFEELNACLRKIHQEESGEIISASNRLELLSAIAKFNDLPVSIDSYNYTLELMHLLYKHANLKDYPYVNDLETLIASNMQYRGIPEDEK